MPSVESDKRRSYPIRPIGDDQVMPIGEFAFLTDLSIATVRRLIGKGEVIAVRLSARRLGVTGRTYRAFLKRRRTQAV